MENKGKGEEEGCKKQGRPTNVEVMRRERSHSAEEVAEIWQRKKKEREEGGKGGDFQEKRNHNKITKKRGGGKGEGNVRDNYEKDG